MKLIIFGATGSVGRVLVDLALQAGNTVTAFTRNPSVFGSEKHLNLLVQQGDLLNLRDVKDAMRGQDGVLCVIGDGGKGTIRATGTENIIKAMKAVGVKKLVCQTTLGLGESRSNLNFFWKHLIFGFLLKKAYRDHEIQEELVRKTDLEWTIVRPSAFTNGKMTGTYRVGFNGDERNLKLKISREDVADFLLKQVTSKQYERREVSISN